MRSIEESDKKPFSVIGKPESFTGKLQCASEKYSKYCQLPISELHLENLLIFTRETIKFV